MTSSCGRMFDAVSSLLGIRHEISHEGQAAMELEAMAESNETIKGYGYDLIDNLDSPMFEISLLPCIRQIVQDLGAGINVAVISMKFHQTLVDAFSASVEKVSKRTGIHEVVLSGGVFNNDILFTRMIDALEQNGLTVYTHSKVPTGDGGISFGQAIAAAAIKGKL